MDDELRRLERSDDPLDWKRLLNRAPVDYLAGMGRELSIQLKALQTKVAMLDVAAPRCRCGAISDGDCADCDVLAKRAAGLEEHWRSMGTWARWHAGEQILEADLKRFLKAWWDYHPRKWACSWPWCAAPNYWSCPHSWMPKGNAWSSRAKPRDFLR